MRISIITVCYNSEKTIEDTIKSIVEQNYLDLEYIIVDGGSDDKTLDIVEKYKNSVTKVISESDNGIYDAMNKGIDMSTGDVVGILNSDDFYYHKDVLREVSAIFKERDVDAVYGDIIYVDREKINKKVRFWRAGEYVKEKLKNGWIMPHPAFFVKRDVYKKYGKFNLDFRIAADYELMLRFLLKNINISYIKKTLVCMREGGYSAFGIKQRKRGWGELKKSWLINNQTVPKLFIPRRILSKIKQFVI